MLAADGSMVEVPVEDMCWDCGTSLEVWPLSTREELLHKLNTSAAFRREFQAVKAGVEKAAHRLFKLQQVSGLKGCGVRLAIKVGLVELEPFKVHFECVPASLQLKVITVQVGPENAAITGVLMSLSDIGPIPHHIVELYGYVERNIETVFLPADGVRRQGQADDRYTLACRNMVKARDPGLKGRNIHNFPSYAAIKKDAKKLQSERESKGVVENECVEAAAKGGSAAVRVRHGSTLDDEDAMPEAKPPPTKKQRASGAGQGRGGGRGKASAGSKLSAAVASTCGSRASVASAAASVASAVSAKSSGSLLLSLDQDTDDVPGLLDDDGSLKIDVIKILHGWKAGNFLKKVPREHTVYSIWEGGEFGGPDVSLQGMPQGLVVVCCGGAMENP